MKTTYEVARDVLDKVISIMPRPLKIVLFLFVILFMGGAISNQIFNTFTNYQCSVIDNTTYVFDITNPDAFNVWQEEYLVKLESQDRLDSLGLNESEMELFLEEYGGGFWTKAKTEVKSWFAGFFTWQYWILSESDLDEHCYRLWRSLTIEERIELSLSSNCTLDDIPEPEDMLPLVTELVDEANTIFYPICVSDDKGGHYPKLSLWGFDVFDFWIWFMLLSVSLCIVAYYRWSDMLGINK